MRGWERASRHTGVSKASGPTRVGDGRMKGPAFANGMKGSRKVYEGRWYIIISWILWMSPCCQLLLQVPSYG